ncbi:hypothetical protein EMPG_15687 [Blastomyces silverae]|uniref:DUF7770 domain-containing protein n=1 Tax=Blastomyces silverae TaxID=2060906 RepID=A0A0H1BCZ2_9EURO|nr:hypothetical protein EMPG_15687 [Blastomyces silverae]
MEPVRRPLLPRFHQGYGLFDSTEIESVGVAAKWELHNISGAARPEDFSYTEWSIYLTHRNVSSFTHINMKAERDPQGCTIEYTRCDYINMTSIVYLAAFPITRIDSVTVSNIERVISRGGHNQDPIPDPRETRLWVYVIVCALVSGRYISSIALAVLGEAMEGDYAPEVERSPSPIALEPLA